MGGSGVGGRRALLDTDTVMGELQLENAADGLKAYPRVVVKCLAAAVEAALGRRGESQRAGGGAKGKNARDILLHPVALFRCDQCGDLPYAWHEINVHWQDKHPNESVWRSERSKVYRASV